MPCCWCWRCWREDFSCRNRRQRKRRASPTTGFSCSAVSRIKISITKRWQKPGARRKLYMHPRLPAMPGCGSRWGRPTSVGGSLLWRSTPPSRIGSMPVQQTAGYGIPRTAGGTGYRCSILTAPSRSAPWQSIPTIPIPSMSVPARPISVPIPIPATACSRVPMGGRAGGSPG